MNKKKRSIMKIFLGPMIALVFLQGILPFALILVSGIKENLETKSVSMDLRIVENRQVILQNAMNDQWAAVAEDEEMLTNSLEEILDANGMEIRGFLRSEDTQEEFLQAVFSELTETLQRNSSSGLFLILANDMPINEEVEYKGFFVRDSDPSTKSITNTDLLLERGGKYLSQQESISLDSSWTAEFRFMGEGARKADDFFYVPYVTAQSNVKTDMINLGYWSEPFILEDYYMDNHRMITYSVPLKYNDTIYGVLGTEVSLALLADYFPVDELDSDLNAGYALAYENDGVYTAVTGKGALYDSIVGVGTDYSLKESRTDNLYEVSGAKIGDQKIYCTKVPMKVYGNNIPYDNSNWVLCGFVAENSIYELGRGLYTLMIMLTVVGVVGGFMIVILLVKHVTRPLSRLVKSISGGISGIHKFKSSGITEIDTLHEVIEDLTDRQKESENRVLEEMERYRLAIGSSQDFFFTYRNITREFEIVNSNEHDGKWKLESVADLEAIVDVYPEDRRIVKRLSSLSAGQFDSLIRARSAGETDYQWYELSTKTIDFDKDGKNMMVFGCLHNVNQQKLEEEERERKKMQDPVTGFMKYKAGTEEIQHRINIGESGVLVLLDVRFFKYISDSFGMTFGDLVLASMAELISGGLESVKEEEPPVFVRAGADEIIYTMPSCSKVDAIDFIHHLKGMFRRIVDRETLTLDFGCGITDYGRGKYAKEVIKEAKRALAVSKIYETDAEYYPEIEDKYKFMSVDARFGEAVSVGILESMSHVSIAFNLFDKNGALDVILDVLSMKLKEWYGVENLIITEFDREGLYSSLKYSRYEEKHDDGLERTEFASEADYKNFIKMENTDELRKVSLHMRENIILGRFVKNVDGLVLHMFDDGNYGGSIIFEGVDFSDEDEEKKNLKEIATIIKNRINQDKHDLLARAKSDFLARMSHEIRTPMNGIIGMTNIALMDGQSEERIYDCLEKIKSSSGFLLRLINDILDMSKIESGKMELAEQPFDLLELIEGIKPMIQPKASEKDIEVYYEINLERRRFVGDSMRINQVLINLLGNAVKYTDMGGHVWVMVTEKDCGDKSELRFSVKDDGMGVSPENQALIFKNFEQIYDPRATRQEGTGLGLAISNHLVRLMGSNISLESELGKGSEFSFTIKLPVSDADVNEKEDDERLLLSAGKRIMIVEDNALNMEIIRTLLSDYGYVVEAAEDGFEAVDMFKKHEAGYYNMIITDITMPGMDGLEEARIIRTMGKADSETIPIVAMSANAFDEDVKKSYASGMNEHLAKPIDFRRLREVLTELLG